MAKKPLDLSSAWIHSLFDSENPLSLSPQSSSIALIPGPTTETDLIKLVNEALSFKTSVAPDLKIDDRDLKEAPNFHAFCMSPHGLGMKPFARQSYIGMKLFHDYCPDCSPDKKFIKSIEHCPVDMDPGEFKEHVQFLRYGVCPKCHKTKLDFLREGKLYFYEELAACIGQRGGKSASVSMYSTYLLHKYLKLQKPTEVLGLLPNQTLVGTFVALNMQGAVELLWSPFQEAVMGSPWFKELFKLLDYYSDLYGEELYKNMTTFLHFKHRNILLYPSGPSKRSLRGRTRIIGAVDELGWMDNSDDSKLRSAEEVYTAIDRSLLTVRSASKRLIKRGYNNILPAYSFNISSPSNAFDKITTLVEANKTSKKVFTVHLPTWEFNPTIKKRDLSKEFAMDPVKAERDYGANPPKATNPFFENASIVLPCFSKVSNLVEYIPEYGTLSGVRVKWIRLTKVPVSVPYNTLMAIDAGEVDNSFAITIGHTQRKDDKSIFPIIDAVIEIAPDKGTASLDFTNIQKHTLNKLIEVFNVKLLLADRWQSIKMLHDLAHKYDLDIETYSVKYADFQLVKSYLMSDGLRLPAIEFGEKEWKNLDYSRYPHCFLNAPVSHLYGQIETVNDLGKTVGKGDLFTDDLFRTLTLATTYLLDEDYQVLFEGSGEAQKARPLAIGSASGFSSNSVRMTHGSAVQNASGTTEDGRAMFSVKGLRPR